MNVKNRKFCIRVIALSCFLSLTVHGHSTPRVKRSASADFRDYAAQLFEHVTGIPLSPNDPRMREMVEHAQNGRWMEAARIATEEEAFYGITLRTISSFMSTRDGSTSATFNDFQATYLGAVRDDLDARLLLTGDFVYRGASDIGLPSPSDENNQHYSEFENRGYGMKRNLVRVDHPRPDLPETAGLLTTRAWGETHMNAGTNRRAVQYAMDMFLCAPISQWRDQGLNDYHVRRDVDRVPGGNPATYQQECRSCHAIMDAMGGAYSKFDFVSGKLKHMGPLAVAPKMNQNSHVYPDGFVTGDADDSWINYATRNHNRQLGWRGPLRGNGLHSYAAMLSESKAFSRCMVKRAYSEICRVAPNGEWLDRTADELEQNGYRLRWLFTRVASDESCVPHPAMNE